MYPELKQPVDQLPISEDLAGFIKSNRFQDLEEMLSVWSVGDLMDNGLSYHCLVELYRWLDKIGCPGYLKE